MARFWISESAIYLLLSSRETQMYTKRSEVNGYARRKDVPRKQYAVAFVIVGVVLAILGVIFNFALDASKTLTCRGSSLALA